MCGLSWSLEMTNMMYFNVKLRTARQVFYNEGYVKVMKHSSEE